MGEATAIEWADATWNPWWGCQKVSPGCANCYAETHANRFHAGLWRGERRRIKDWSLPARVDRRAAREGRRLRLFVASMADIFDGHELVAEWRLEALGVIEALRYTDVLLLTKRIENVQRMVPAAWLDAWPAHVWIGTTVEDQARADERVPHLLRVPARVRFLSVEPMLGPVDLTELPARWADNGKADAPLRPLMRLDALRGGYWLTRAEKGLRRTDPGPETQGEGGPPTARVHWVIAGGESGPEARSSSLRNARSLRDQCAAAGVPFMWKQWGSWAPTEDNDFVAGAAQVVKVDGWHMARLGKKAAGRLLDGVEHNEFPEVSRVG